jgi:hypothetical protein
VLDGVGVVGAKKDRIRMPRTRTRWFEYALLERGSASIQAHRVP